MCGFDESLLIDEWITPHVRVPAVHLFFAGSERLIYLQIEGNRGLDCLLVCDGCSGFLEVGHL